ncbi:MAG: flagellar hook-associated protein FlgL [Christensenellales bacterium]|jgi:flagellar hook-associated protein 3 FlgL
MRITSSMIMNTFLSNLNNNLNSLDRLQAQSSSNRRIVNISDDPVGLLTTLQVRDRINDIEQYSRNIDEANLWLRQAENSMMEINSIITSCYEDVLRASTSTMSPTDRQAVAAKIAQMRDQLVNVSNSRMNNKYVFGGYNTVNEPFEVSGGVLYYNGIDMVNGDPVALEAQKDQKMEFEIAAGGLKMNVAFTGVELLGTGEDNLYGILDRLYDALEADAPGNELAAYADVLLEKQSEMLGMISDAGARCVRLDMLRTRYEDDTLNYTKIQSQIEDVDQAEVYMNYKMAEAVYQASLSAGARIIQPTLLDFL